MTKQHGRHLIIDGIFDKDMIRTMSDRTAIGKYLEDVTEITGMTLVFPPVAMTFPFSGETNRLIEKLEKEGKCNNSEIFQEFKKHINNRNTCGGGVSSIAVWVESHCSVHTWTEKLYVSIDLFSCSSYDIAPVIEYTKNFFNFQKAYFVVVDRYMDGTAPIITSFPLENWNGNFSGDVNKKLCAV